MSNKSKKVFVAMSGGVDSSVAALLLKQQGYDVTGVFMKCYNLDGCADRDAADARRVAAKLKIPFYVWDFEKEYKKRVVKYMIDGYRNGITPNPDVMCNKEIKFGMFLERALKLGADYIATGHYVRLNKKVLRKQHNFPPAGKFASLSPQHFSLSNSGSKTKLLGLRDVSQNRFVSDISRYVSDKMSRRQIELGLRRSQSAEGQDRLLPLEKQDGRFWREYTERGECSFSLLQAKDKNKDQSYFLWTLTQKQLQYCLFPVGCYTKSEVRAIAKKAGLPTAKKKDSQGICFLGDISLFDFLATKLPRRRGAIITTDGIKIGKHEGAWFYTIGQRHGLNLNEKNIALHKKGKTETKPHYVVGKDIKKNILIVAEGEKDTALFRREVTLVDVNIADPKLASKKNFHIAVHARVRYRQPLFSAVLKRAEKKVILRFQKPQKFVAEGQSAVFYSVRGTVLGGGIIR